MKPTHSKQNSLDFKVSSSLNEAYAQKTEALAKTYRKKTQIDEPVTLQLLYRPPNTLTRHPPPRQSKKSAGKTAEQSKLSGRKSQARLLNEHSIERLRTLYKPTESGTIGVKTKISKVVGVMDFKPKGDVKDILQQFYQATCSIQTLQQQWRRLDLYDDIDALISRLIDNFTYILEELTLKAHTFATESLARVQKQACELQQQNASLRSLLSFHTNRFELQIMQAENRVYEQYQKNQWSTFIFNELALSPFNLQCFAKQSKAYLKAVKECQPHTVTETKSKVTREKSEKSKLIKQKGRSMEQVMNGIKNK